MSNQISERLLSYADRLERAVADNKKGRHRPAKLAHIYSAMAGKLLLESLNRGEIADETFRNVVANILEETKDHAVNDTRHWRIFLFAVRSWVGPDSVPDPMARFRQPIVYQYVDALRDVAKVLDTSDRANVAQIFADDFPADPKLRRLALATIENRGTNKPVMQLAREITGETSTKRAECGKALSLCQRLSYQKGKNFFPP